MIRIESYREIKIYFLFLAALLKINTTIKSFLGPQFFLYICLLSLYKIYKNVIILMCFQYLDF